MKTSTDDYKQTEVSDLNYKAKLYQTSLRKLSEFNMQQNLNKSSIWKQRYLQSRDDITSNPPMWILVSFNQQQIPENRITTNPEYTNTQQDLSDYGIYLADS